MQFVGTVGKWIDHHTKPPVYNGSPSDWGAYVNVTEDVEELVAQLEKTWEEMEDWYSKNKKSRGRASYFPQPWVEEDDGSVTVRIKAKPERKEFPFPVVDGDLVPLAEDIYLRTGSVVIVHAEHKFYSPNSKSGGYRIRPLGIQVIKAVTGVAQDSGGEKDLTANGMFEKRKGFKQDSPKVEKPDNVSDEDPDF